ncbi:MAG: alpha-ketoacid dehydrogenase subunit beta [Myxococcota bacterium]
MTTYVEAIRQALFDEMERDPSVVCIGEDIGHFGGAFKATKGLLEAFGPMRVMDTPIAESLIVGTSIGAAIRGLRPVAEMQFADFVTCGFSQLVNNAATFHYRLGVSVPMVVRLPAGGGVGAGPFHSKNPEAWFLQAPGLKVVAPATVEDAYGLLLAAIRDPDPVIYLEQKYYYRRLKGAFTPGKATPLGACRVARAGSDVTVATYANGVAIGLEAAEKLENEGVSVEVLDLRTLMPWDWRGVLASVERTHRLLLLSEASSSAGFIAEVAAVVADLGFDRLDAPIRRLSFPDVPVPAHPDLEAALRPDADRLCQDIRDLVAY